MQDRILSITRDYKLIIKTIDLDIIQRVICGPKIPEKIKLVKFCSD